MTLRHRPVMADDIKTICSFPQDARELFYMFPKAQYPLTEAQLSDAINQRFDSTVFERGNNVVGFANFYRAEKGGVCCIGNVIVAQQARGKGVASFIVKTMTALAFDRYDASEVQISCFNENTAGLLLYPKLGFLPFAIEERSALDNRRSALIHMSCVRAGRRQ
ncbi:GNAT family N-acetyltransferase [Pseudomonas fluorescens]|uniref:GNAT family N-acetyltransferase n=1 Tax=Pseudomonas fluorescens TaxID=294 RepID=A0A944DEH2_PSEFL|nr:GNAT family protein [Pseudomonas fluorescens]MBT2294038.1 GNAT family N-acetyltransferase [Pseudomonas fluorescens]MBT2307305.1 GNAT family N-acetyltransferase [Pseudomonas fluorescens]MBT2311238.1 GNAT family N-acetyltransferase [Pseudomonas fluorescens]MBT2319707.1 GNAT family N-acetyltransferase [Pseudomonas fluorescens]MBT2327442.1 GNAT family N-acetyltransferase [Pseudomonas fluorescens]